MTPEQAAVEAAVLELADIAGSATPRPDGSTGVYAGQAPDGAEPPYAVVTATSSEDVLVQGTRLGTVVRLRVDVLVAGERAAYPAARPARWSRPVGGQVVEAVPVGAQSEAYEDRGRPWRRTVLDYSAAVRPSS